MIFAILAMLCYLSALLQLSPMLVKVQLAEKTYRPNKKLFFTTAVSALALHLTSLISLSEQISNGVSIMQVSSFVSLVIASLATAAILLRVRTLWFLLPIMYGFAIINLIFASFLPHQQLAAHQGLFFHIALSLVAYAVCFIATLYSIQIHWIDRQLKLKKMQFSPLMPPLMLVERHFFRVLLSGEILLTITLISGAFVLADFFAPHNVQKAIFTFLAWLVFGWLLIGHWKWHWRGKKLIIFTITGMTLLSFAYFISRAMLSLA